jgi:hypothetical protein
MQSSSGDSIPPQNCSVKLSLPSTMANRFAVDNVACHVFVLGEQQAKRKEKKRNMY